MKSLYTIGYEGKTIDEFLDMLKEHSIQCVIDVRERSVSRKKGFSKSALKQFLNKNNIQYEHFRNLGSPKEVREHYHSTHDFPAFARQMNNHLNTQTGSLKNLFEIIRKKRCCLMCFETNAVQCHRILVAKKIDHLFPKQITIKNV